MRCVYSVACTSPDTLYVLQISYRTQSTAVHIIPVRLYDSALLWVLLSGTGIAAIFIVFDLYDNLTHIYITGMRGNQQRSAETSSGRGLSLYLRHRRVLLREQNLRADRSSRDRSRAASVTRTHTHARTHKVER